MTAPTPGAPWLQQAFHEICRHRHLVIHGNVEDRIRWEDMYIEFADALTSFLILVGFAGVARYGLVDGLTHVDDESRQIFSHLSTGRAPAGPTAAAESP